MVGVLCKMTNHMNKIHGKKNEIRHFILWMLVHVSLYGQWNCTGMSSVGYATKTSSLKIRVKVAPQGFKLARVLDDASFSNVHGLADASSSKIANKYSSNYSPGVEKQKHFKENCLCRRYRCLCLQRQPRLQMSSNSLTKTSPLL